MEFSNVWQKKVKPALRKADTPTLVGIHTTLRLETLDECYQQTAYDLGFDPIKQRERAVADLVHGPTTGPYQETL